MNNNSLFSTSSVAHGIGKFLSTLMTSTITRSGCLVGICFTALAFLSLQSRAIANNEIFPAIGAAQEKINWKDGYFLIDGKPTFITAGEMHYARIPRELWRDRLWRVKQMGFNTVQMYVFWNAHQPKEGQWDFTDNLDLDAWLSLIQEMGMYAIVRVGPYSCAEWEHGGFPAWLTIKKDMAVRDMDDQYNKFADAHLAKIEEIVAKHQIHKGGNVIMVQLENEHGLGWGTDPFPYLVHLYEKARANGLEVPLFFSGLHHGSDPSGEAVFKMGNSPWYSTEFWTGWIGRYGDMADVMLQEKVRGTWKIIAFGGAGYDYYVVHGGTNFGYSGDSLETTYDYSAPIGEAGQFHNLYAPARRAASFAQSFSSLLTASTNLPDFAESTTPGVRVISRGGPNGTAVFVDNFSQGSKRKDPAAQIAPTAGAYKEEAAPGKIDVTTRLKVKDLGEFPRDGSLLLHPHEIRTAIFNLPWTPAASFESICTNILLRHPFGNKEIWVCYGNPGEYGEITLRRKNPGNAPLKFSMTYPKDDTVQEIAIDSGDGKQVQLLVMNTSLADRTWLANEKLIVGASFIREDGSPLLPPEGGKITVYSATGQSESVTGKLDSNPLPALTNWEWRGASSERNENYPDSKWLESKDPQAMESYDSFQNRYGWYRTVLHAEAAGPVHLRFMGQEGSFYAFLNGEPADLKKLPLKVGDNHLAIFAKIGPRPKLYNFLGPVGTDAARGIWGPTTTDDKPIATVTDWKQFVANSKDDSLAQPDFNDQTWEAVSPVAANNEIKLENDIYWFRGSFEIPVAPKFAFATFPQLNESNSTKGRIFINGKPVIANKSHLNPMDISKFLRNGRNSVAIEVTGVRPARWIRLKMDVWAAREPTLWKFRGGLEDLHETAIVGRVTNWDAFIKKPWSKVGAPQFGLPTLWKTTFEYHAKSWETVGLSTDGLKSGHVWLNGHNLGECPQKVPLYMPECWLKDGANTLVVFDVGGAKPDQLKLMRYQALQIGSK